ncbi:MAG TPA: GGDEF domain-containing protein [Candidatus Sulfotelmatobacter sp.]|nr:GGDEF domain-containing protein [Candidatus Sulfotelmatobacter sp.]
MNPLRHPKLWVATTLVFTALLAIASAVLPKGLALAAVSDIVSAGLMLSALLVFAANGVASKGRMRWFWMLQSAGWALWLGDQMVWITFDLILQRKVPQMYPADALLFLAGAPMLAGLLLRPHRQPSERSARLGILDFSLLFLWWLYLYVSFVVCWQYVWPDEASYNQNFDLLSIAEAIILSGVTIVFWLQTSGRWKTFYACLCGAVVFNSVTFYVLNRAIEKDVYFTGSWYDIPYSGSFALFTAVAVVGQRLSATPETAGDGPYNDWMANLAMLSVLSLPVIAFYALIDPRLPPQASHFRVLVTLATVFLMAFLLFIQHHRLNQELRRTNVVLEEASLTDPLTGLRNRRYFSATIESDVSQALRSHADCHDAHTRDLVFYLIDADNFKEINDRYGHDVGDKVLLEMARRLSSSIRHSDVLVRWGGEEFLIVSRYTDRSEAELLAQRALSAVADAPFTVSASGETLYRTCSMGWAAFPWFSHDPRAVSYEEVLTLADRALNRAKQTGKNRAVGMLPAAGKVPATTVEGLHSTGLQVDVLATAGPRTGA